MTEDTLALMVHSALAGACLTPCRGKSCVCEERAAAFARASMRSHAVLLGEDTRPVHTVVNQPGRPLVLVLSFWLRPEGNTNGVDFLEVATQVALTIGSMQITGKEVFSDPFSKRWITRVTVRFPQIMIDETDPTDEAFRVPLQNAWKELKRRGIGLDAVRQPPGKSDYIQLKIFPSD